MAEVIVTHVGAVLHRLDVPCASLGMPDPPAPADLKVVRAGTGWTVTLACAPRHAAAFTAWLHATGAADVQPAAGNEPARIRARFHALPAPWAEILRDCRLENASIEPGGHASVLVRGSPDAVTRLAHAIGTGTGEGPALATPPLTARQAELLQYCVMRGYYSIPRRASLRRLSGELGISTTSLSIALRRAEAKIILAHAARLRRIAADDLADAAVIPLPPPPRRSRPVAANL